jgi:hypothetical protein
MERIERAMELVQPVTGTVTLRGDTDLTNTAELDRWDDRAWRFLLGIDAHPNSHILHMLRFRGSHLPPGRDPVLRVPDIRPHKLAPVGKRPAF